MSYKWLLHLPSENRHYIATSQKSSHYREIRIRKMKRRPKNKTTPKCAHGSLARISTTAQMARSLAYRDGSVAHVFAYRRRLKWLARSHIATDQWLNHSIAHAVSIANRSSQPKSIYSIKSICSIKSIKSIYMLTQIGYYHGSTVLPVVVPVFLPLLLVGC